MLQITPSADFARSPIVRGLWVATMGTLIACLVVLITGAAADVAPPPDARPRSGVPQGDTVNPGVAASDPTTSVPGAAPGPAVPTTAPPGGSSQTGGASKVGSASAPGGPAAVARLQGEPSPGSYRYRISTKNGEDPAEQSEGTSMVEAMSADASGTRQKVTIQGPRGSTRMQTLWQTGTVRIVEQSFNFGGFDATCRWEPALLLRPAPLKVGATWRGDSTCDMKVGPNSFTLRLVEDGKVLGTESLKVGGKDVKVFVIERRSTQTSDEAGFKGTTHTIERFAPDFGLVVKAHAEGTFTFRATTSTYETDQELLSTTPS